MKFVLPIFMAALTFGCGPSREKLPTYSWPGAPAALRVMSERAKSIKTVSSECLLTLDRINGDSIRLDGAIAIQSPGKVRLRAWKFGQAVFDLTLNPDGLWVEAPRDEGRRQQVLPATVGAGQMARACSLFMGDFFAAPELKIEDKGGPRFTVTRPAGDAGQIVSCEIDRRTLTPRRYSVMARSGALRFTLLLDHYRQFGNVIFPDRLTAHSFDGTIGVELRNTEVNVDLPPKAFVPPKGAEKLP